MSTPPRSSIPPKLPIAAAPAAPGHRSGAVARMLRMPVATLRVWERRYALTRAALSPGGQRLYSAEDVRRLALLKQLVDLGHAIGSLAPLDLVQLQRVASTHAQSLAAIPTARRARAAPVPSARAWRLVVVGQALGARLQRPALLRQLGRPVEVLGPFADVSQAAAAVAATTGERPVEAWLLHEPQLHAGWWDAIVAATPALAGVPKAVLFGFGADAVCNDLAARGVALLREPQPDVVLAQWLRHWAGASAPQAPDRATTFERAGDGVAPRRWDDATLSDFAALSTTVACECPRHVAELLMLLSRFEVYSVQCEQLSPADAELHAGLARVAAGARASFESAMEQVALHEGLLLPPSSA